MKRIILLAAAAISLAACSNDDDNYIDDTPVAAHITATIGQSAVSRAGDTSWAPDDAIGITMSGESVYRYVNMRYTTPEADGVFTGTDMYLRNKRVPVTLTAYYPFTGTQDTPAGTLQATTTADLQTSAGQPKFDFLWATLANVLGDANPKVIKFTFTHQMSKLTFTFKKGNDGTDVSKIISYRIDGLKLDGTFDTATGVCAATGDAAPLTMDVTGKVSDAVALTPIIVFPQAGDNVKLTLIDNEGQYYECPLSFGTDGIRSGNNYQFTVKISKTGLSIETPTITDWTDKVMESPEAGSVD